MPSDRPDAALIWTPTLAILFLYGAAAMTIAFALLVLIGFGGAVGLFLLLTGFPALFAADWIVFNRASRGQSWVAKLGEATAIRRRAYRWSAIRGALRQLER